LARYGTNGPIDEDRLHRLAVSQGQDEATLARRILLDYLDLQALPADLDDDWAEASIALAPEIMEQEDWGESTHGS
jgi:hypothetical protein